MNSDICDRSILRTAMLATVIVSLLSAMDVPADVPHNGLIVAVSGQVTVLRNGQEVVAEVGRQLLHGDTIVARQGGRCVGYTPSGERFELSGPGELVLERKDEASALGGVANWIHDQFARWIGESRRQPLIMRTARAWEYEVFAPLPLVPGREGKVRARSSVLRWATIPGIDSYTVTIAPERGDEIVRTVRGGSLRLQNMQPGAAYSWQVVPAVTGWTGSSFWRGFQVLSEQEEVELEQALRGVGELEAGVILLAIGLHEEAIAYLDTAIARDVDADSARIWRAHAWAELGLHRLAYEDLLRVRSPE